MSFNALSSDPAAAVPAGVPDVRGWPVRSGVDAQRVGVVDDLLLADGHLCYLAVRLSEANRVLIPVEYTYLAEQPEVVIAGVTAAEMDALPRYPDDAAVVTRDFETKLRRSVPAFMVGQTDSGQARAWSRPGKT
jgi:hypothetical protein